MPVASTALDTEEPSSNALRLRDFVPVEFVRRGAVAGRTSPFRGAVEPKAAAVTALPASGEPSPDPGRGMTDQVTLFLDADL
jgi:hypothetical protein